MAIVRFFRRTRAGLRLWAAFASLSLLEKITGGVMALLMVMVTAALLGSWVMLQVENAQILVGTRDPRERPDRDAETWVPPRVPDHTTFTFPDFPPLPPPDREPWPPTFPTLQVPDLPEFEFPDLTLPSGTGE